MSDVECFLLTPTNRYMRTLRRYSRETRCVDGVNCHDARRMLDIIEDVEQPASDDHWPHVDPRWPAVCDRCVYVFGPADHWQLFHEHMYVGPDGVEHKLMTAPAGAMWFADWYPETWKGPDGHCLVVMLPDGSPWLVDGPAANSFRPWTRTGLVPRVTARPSILTPKYHGFLTDGLLRAC